MKGHKSIFESTLLIRELNSKLNRWLGNKIKDNDVTVPQITLLQLLFKYNKLKVCEISEMMSIKDSTTSRIIDRLEDRKLVTRSRSEDDKRVVLIQLTKEGYKIVENLEKNIDECFRTELNTISKDQITTIVTGIKILNVILDS